MTVSLFLQILAIQEIVSCTEKALKLVSDQIADEDHTTPSSTENPSLASALVSPTKAESAESKALATSAESGGNKEPQVVRALKGVMRVGLLAKGLLLKGDTDVQLIVLCAQKPTRSLLERVYTILLQKIDVSVGGEGTETAVNRFIKRNNLFRHKNFFCWLSSIIL